MAHISEFKMSPVVPIGVIILMISTGSLLSQTLFVEISAFIGLSLLTSTVLWMVIGVVIITLGIIHQFEVVSNAE